MKRKLILLLAFICLLLTGHIRIAVAETPMWPVPASKSISQNYWASHPALDIIGGGNIVATKAGTVYYVYTGCGNSSAASTGVSCSSATCNPSAGWSSLYSIGGVSTCNWAVGNGVVLQHNDGTYSCYCHMATVSVTKGQNVSQGTVLGTMGSTGNSTGMHLHFEIASGKEDRGTYIQLTGQYNTNPSVMTYIYGNEVISYSFENYEKFYELEQNYAHFGTKIYGSIGSASKVGCELYNASKALIGSCEDNAYSEGGCLIHHFLFKSGSSDINISLTPGTNYYYRYYVITGGKKYPSDYYSFKTFPSTSTNISYSFEDYAKFYELGNDYAHFGVKIYGSVESAIYVGCELYNSGKSLLGSCQDGAYLEGNCLIHHYSFKPGSSDIDITLSPNTKYFYRYYVVAGSNLYYSDFYEFTTTQPSTSFTYENYEKFYELGEQFAHFGVKIYGNSVSSATAVGCELYNANKAVIGSCQDAAYLEGNCLIHHYLFQSGSSDINID